MPLSPPYVAPLLPVVTDALSGPFVGVLVLIPTVALSPPFVAELIQLPGPQSGSINQFLISATPSPQFGETVQPLFIVLPDPQYGKTSNPELLPGPFTPTCPPLLAGTIGRTPPANFTIVSVTAGAVTLSWDVVTDADLKNDELVTSLDGDTTADPPSLVIELAPEETVAHLRTVIGYKLHKGLPGFVPEGTQIGEGNVIEDFTTLPPGSTGYIDLAVTPDDLVAYVLATQVDNGF